MPSTVENSGSASNAGIFAIGAGLAQFFSQHLEEFAGARLKNFAHHALRHQARGPIADRRDLDFVAFRDQRGYRVAEILLEALRLREASAHADRKIAGEVIAAHWDHRGMRNRA